MIRLASGILALGAAFAATKNEDGSPDFYDLKCSACCSTVAELERNLETEKPRMNVDLRRTLAGGDKGKNIDYMVRTTGFQRHPSKKQVVC